MKWIIVGNKGSYYHEGFWQGRKLKFSKSKAKAKLFNSRGEAEKESRYIEQHVINGTSSFIVLETLDAKEKS